MSRLFGGAGARPGGAGHSLVYNTWKTLGGKFAPWGAVNASRTIGKISGRTNVALGAGFVVWEMLQRRRQHQAAAAAARARRAAEWSETEALDLAQEIVQPWRDAAERTVASIYEIRLREVARQRLTVLARLTEQDDEAGRLLGLAAQIDGLTCALDPSTQ